MPDQTCSTNFRYRDAGTQTSKWLEEQDDPTIQNDDARSTAHHASDVSSGRVSREGNKNSADGTEPPMGGSELNIEDVLNQTARTDRSTQATSGWTTPFATYLPSESDYPNGIKNTYFFTVSEPSREKRRAVVAPHHGSETDGMGRSETESQLNPTEPRMSIDLDPLEIERRQSSIDNHQNFLRELPRLRSILSNFPVDTTGNVNLRYATSRVSFYAQRNSEKSLPHPGEWGIVAYEAEKSKGPPDRHDSDPLRYFRSLNGTTHRRIIESPTHAQDLEAYLDSEFQHKASRSAGVTDSGHDSEKCMRVLCAMTDEISSTTGPKEIILVVDHKGPLSNSYSNSNEEEPEFVHISPELGYRPGHWANCAETVDEWNRNSQTALEDPSFGTQLSIVKNMNFAPNLFIDWNSKDEDTDGEGDHWRGLFRSRWVTDIPEKIGWRAAQVHLWKSRDPYESLPASYAVPSNAPPTVRKTLLPSSGGVPTDESQRSAPEPEGPVQRLWICV
ncbi:hypothetical protein IAT40_000838 [Kwoniella sp. CBS 6097]